MAVRKPSKLLSITGAYKKHPERKRLNEPIPVGEIGPAPKTFMLGFADIWEEIVSITPDGVLTDADRVHLEIVCHLIAEFRGDQAEFTAAKLTRLDKMIGKIGLNPTDRSRVIVPGKPKGNPFNQI